LIRKRLVGVCANESFNLADSSPFGATIAVIFVGLGFASIYPLTVEKIGNRLPDYHPGFYNGMFSLGLLGGFLVPALAGSLAAKSDVQIVMLLPLSGSIMVLTIFIAISIESREARQGIRTDAAPSGPS
jgi:fucose permease